MDRQEQTNNQLPEVQNASMNNNDSLDSQENQIVYIAELNGEFFTVDYNQEQENPTVTPLKIVEFMHPTATMERTDNAQLTPIETNENDKLQPIKDSLQPIPFARTKKPKLSNKKSQNLNNELDDLNAKKASGYF